MSERGYFEIHKDEWIRVPRSGFRLACCDCSLVHRVKIKAVGRHFDVLLVPDPRATAAMRRPMEKTRKIVAKRAKRIVDRMK